MSIISTLTRRFSMRAGIQRRTQSLYAAILFLISCLENRDLTLLVYDFRSQRLTTFSSSQSHRVRDRHWCRTLLPALGNRQREKDKILIRKNDAITIRKNRYYPAMSIITSYHKAGGRQPSPPSVPSFPYSLHSVLTSVSNLYSVPLDITVKYLLYCLRPIRTAFPPT